MGDENLSSVDVNHNVSLSVEHEECLNYVAWQNAVPLLKSLTLKNCSNKQLDSITIGLSVTPFFATQKTWNITRLAPSDEVRVKDLDIQIESEYLQSLDEATLGTLLFHVSAEGKTLCEHKSAIRVLAHDEWGGLPAMRDLLPAFVTPNAPDITVLLKTSSKILEESGHSKSIDGYQSGDPNRSFMLAAALWSAVCKASLTYAVPPTSFEKSGQKVRKVSTVLHDKLATCLDSTLLFASGLEAMGLNPVLIMMEGHCFVGLWLIEKTLKQMHEADCVEIRKAVDANQLLVFETTLSTSQSPKTFPVAVDVARSALSVSLEHTFISAIDVKRSRMAQIRPLATLETRNDSKLNDDDAKEITLPKTPKLRVASTEPEEKPKTPVGRIDRWQRKLLDLSLRNKLLNFTASRQSIPIICPNPSELEDELAAGKRFRLVSLNDENKIADRDPKLHQQRTKKDLDLQFSREAFKKRELSCLLETKEVEKRLTGLYRKAKSDLAEGGSNTLYLAIGFLRWKKDAESIKTYRAPLLLLPIKLHRRSVSSPYYVAHHEDEVRFNSTLLQLLKKDFNCDLTSLESSLPQDQSGIDVPKILEAVKQAVFEIKGFEVIDDVAISRFSFAKYLMWKDLVDQVEHLTRNRVVDHLVNNPDKPFRRSDGLAMPSPRDIDQKYQPADLVHPLPADSSQLSAVMAAAEGQDLVIVGPPGTGKSQTIANLIGQCLAGGKTILFVAEKTAALDVVHRRLKEHGLGDCCIELHSNKAERKRFLIQLGKSWERGSKSHKKAWLDINGRLKIRRDELNAYVNEIHAKHENGITVYHAMGLCAREKERISPALSWPRDLQHSKQQYSSIRDVIYNLALTHQALPTGTNLGKLSPKTWSMSWEKDLLLACSDVINAGNNLTSSIKSFRQLLDINIPIEISLIQLDAINCISAFLYEWDAQKRALLECSDLVQLQSEIQARLDLLAQHKQAELDLSSALSTFAGSLVGSSNSSIDQSAYSAYYQLANELTKEPAAHASLVFHSDLQLVVAQLDQRLKMLKDEQEAANLLVDRNYNPQLLKRLNLRDTVILWQRAENAIWPFSIFQKDKVKKRLNAIMKSGALSQPDIDIELLQEYADCRKKLDDNLKKLGLSADLTQILTKEPGKLAPLLESAKAVREAIIATGVSLAALAALTNRQLLPLVLAARPIYPAARKLEELRTKIGANACSRHLKGELKAFIEKDPTTLTENISALRLVRQALDDLEISHSEFNAKVATLDLGKKHRDVFTDCLDGIARFQTRRRHLGLLANSEIVDDGSISVISEAVSQADHIISNRSLLKQWAAWCESKRQAAELGLIPFVAALSDQTLPRNPNDAAAVFDLAYARWWLPTIVDKSDVLRAFQGYHHEDAIRDFQELDQLARENATNQILSKMGHDLPSKEYVPRKSELGLLRHQLSLKRPSKSIRDVISGLTGSFSQLAPCMLMSPLSISQYLPPNQKQFDVVVFDEASQITTWDAIGAIARGKQTIIVGDPKQLPPTNFFGRNETDQDDPDIDDHETDLESILDEAQASGLPTLQLNWHYRSQHESLITFSNYKYYNNKLITFPAATNLNRGVFFSHVQGGCYDRGKSRTNRKEADAIVADAIARMKRCMLQPESERLTYGVVTFNSQQQTLIQDLFDEALRKEPELEWFFADERIEPTAVKNLENVQGDERDVMYFSITFGKDISGKFPIDFGAINRAGGERRLNVAITRARQTLLVFTSFLSEELRSERSTARGVHDLKTFLQYAEKGPIALARESSGSVGEYESPLEEAVANALESRGWKLDAQVGVSGFRVDIGIIHPDKPGAYLAGVECDGFTYHRSAAARDRDKTRQHVLEGLGWKILRVWSPDWWYDSENAMNSLHTALRALLADSQAETNNSSTKVASTSISRSVNDQTSTSITLAAEHNAAAEVALGASKERVVFYEIAELPNSEKNQERFFDAEYNSELRELALLVVQTEAPVYGDILVRRIARAHGFARTGNRIKDRITELLHGTTTTNDANRAVFWNTTSPPNSLPFRHAKADQEHRVIDDIPPQELLGLAIENNKIFDAEDPAKALAAAIGLARLTKGTRKRLEEVLKLAQDTKRPE